VQLIAIELAMFAVGGAILAGDPVYVVVAGVAAAILLALTLGRSSGRWLYQLLAARRRLRRRRQDVRAVLRDTGDVELAAVVPGVSIRALIDRGTAIGIGQDPAGWFAAVSVLSWIGPVAQHPPALGLDRLARLLTDPVMPVSAMHLVSHRAATTLETGAAPNELVWLALRLGSWDAADAAANRGGGLDGVDRALAAALGRIGTLLAGADMPHEVLDADSLRHALTVSCGLRRPGGQPESQVDERWKLWSAEGAVHVCFAVRAWPAQPAPDLLDQIGRLPAAAVDTAILLAPHGSDVTLRALVRVTATPERIAESVRRLRENAARLGVHLVRTDGEHATGVYGTAPTAWTPVSPAPTAWATATRAPAMWAPQIAAPRARPPVVTDQRAWTPPTLTPPTLTAPPLAPPTLTPPTITMPKTR
jgi:type VII secretion protein EccE